MCYPPIPSFLGTIPFILFDLENKERILVKRIRRALDGNPGDIENLFHRIDPISVPRPLTAEFIRAAIAMLRERIGQIADRGLVVIDTMRTAKAGSGKKENDEDDMRERKRGHH
jgi:hypothetical protein